MATVITHPAMTSDLTLRRDLLLSLNQRGVAAGLTFGDFVAALRAYGVTDNTRLESIEFGVIQRGTRRVTCHDDEGDGLVIRELSASEWDRANGRTV